MKKLVCYLKAIPFFIKSGIWCPHVYKEVGMDKGIVIARQNNFRISNNLIHNNGETVYPHATIIRNKCIYCGHEDLSWYDNEPVRISD